ncbi:aldo/keto reductase [Candidatus Microgenomates bacterium]|nr:MAG: aldo/keto reductase [Candidatus Microgenomates bacterium]
MVFFEFKDGSKVPALGLGTWNLTGENGKRAVAKALEIGYRHFDTAEAYGNHRIVGEAIAESGIERKEIFITSKVPSRSLLKEAVIESGKRALDELKTDYLDLFLIHWPNPSVPIKETLSGFSELKEKELIRSIGVSNFGIEELKEALKEGVKIVNNQVELHPSFNQSRLKSYCAEEKIIITAYSPFAQGKDLKLKEINKLSEKYNHPASQIIINWIIQKEMIAIPKSGNEEHLRENFNALEWKLAKEDIDLIDKIS